MNCQKKKAEMKVSPSKLLLIIGTAVTETTTDIKGSIPNLQYVCLHETKYLAYNPLAESDDSAEHAEVICNLFPSFGTSAGDSNIKNIKCTQHFVPVKFSF